MNTALWVVQGLLAGLFLVAGAMEVVAYDRMEAMAAQRDPGGARPTGEDYR